MQGVRILVRERLFSTISPTLAIAHRRVYTGGSIERCRTGAPDTMRPGCGSTASTAGSP